jgi:tetratricopeptide (TPR) repeat protein
MDNDNSFKKEPQEIKKEVEGRGEKAKKGCLGCFLLFIIIFFLFHILTGGIFLTPSISGKVIDAETKKPIYDARIRVEWNRQLLFWIDSPRVAMRKETYTTDLEGNFKIPSYFLLLFPGTILSDAEFLLYAHGYKAEIITREPGFFWRLKRGRFTPEQKDILPKGLKRKGTIIELKPLKTAEEWWERIERFGYEDDLEKNQFYLEECELFIKKFPQSEYAPLVLLKIARIKQGYSKEEAIEAFKKVIELYPDTRYADEARGAIGVYSE